MAPGKNAKKRAFRLARVPPLAGTSILPQTITPPLDPPTVVVDKLRVQTFTANLTTTASTATTYSTASLVARIRLQAFSAATVAFHYQVISVQVWGPSASQLTLALTEQGSGRTWEDNGSQSQRPRVGFKFDKPGQVIRSSGDSSTTLFEILTSPGSDFQVHVRVCFWTGQSDVQ